MPRPLSSHQTATGNHCGSPQGQGSGLKDTCLARALQLVASQHLISSFLLLRTGHGPALADGTEQGAENGARSLPVSSQPRALRWALLGVQRERQHTQCPGHSIQQKPKQQQPPWVSAAWASAALVRARRRLPGAPAGLTMALFSLMFMVLLSSASELSWPSALESSSHSEAESSPSFPSPKLLFLPRTVFLLSSRCELENSGSEESFLSDFFADFLVGNCKATRRPILFLLGPLLLGVASSSSSYSSSSLTADASPSALP